MQKNLKQLHEAFLFECEFVRKMRPATIRGYLNSFNLFMNIVQPLEVSQIKSEHIMLFFKQLQERKRLVGRATIKTGVKKSTIASYWTKLNVFFCWLKTNRHITENPFSQIPYPVPSYEEKQYLHKEQIEKILTAIHISYYKNLLLFKRNLLLFHVLLFCGLRREETLLLQIRDIDFATKMLVIRPEISKSGRSRYIPLHAAVLLHLRDYLAQRATYKTPFLFVSSSRDAQLTDNGLKHLIEAIRAKSGIPFHLHQFRHTFAVNFLKQTGNIFKLKSLLGHKDISMTAQYLRCMPPEELRADVETLTIDSFL